MSSSFRLALYQGPSPSGDEAAAFATVERVLTSAAAMGADLAVFPEAYLLGYNLGQMISQPLDGPWVGRLGELTAKSGVAAVVGMSERDGEACFNTAVALGPDGALLATYRKIQLWEAREASIWKPGEAYVTFPFRGRTIGLLICYDIEFPEHVRALVRKGADLIVVPTANPEPFDNVNRFAVPARAMENAISMAYCNYCGTERGATYCGRSLIAGPEGDPLAMAGTTEALLIADIPAPGDAMDRPTEHLADLKVIP
ncbi:MAG: carbon-nitrogen hydrolase family protein [Pseudomonadota bacterium]